MKNKLKKGGTYLIVDKARRQDEEDVCYKMKSILGEEYTIRTNQECAKLRDSIAWYLCNTDDYDTLMIVNGILSIRYRDRRVH